VLMSMIVKVDDSPRTRASPIFTRLVIYASYES
jgi:hypothetical protein